ncbi:MULTISPECIES: type I-F CRISPR-associated endoribonuclease Cas6/Csy4 [Acinetobacter]|jgi:CRISPR-associated endonuclease Csy4|uniref:Type I-F CRISPR-associated endoribonuclease Cas6/Csy4 n=2 Tax=Acinetobacter TaxID=469 RepID=A0AAW5R8E7_ACIJU|nr:MULTISPECIES: type I-F CRISPR-associated endoribonuclease Cas6/Csy4 [Acinetobacter]AUX91036.1 type I-F CRISPR-associated endoribonuclease Cas6/Csy4 [Acinetobacter sp. ACNIH1]EXC31314.1 CRISPR-associated family protein [Acinetobacter sp. 869535]MCU4327557.1 type I-F CRISPR-associated endoribonuclease Cas6/Csy4 [Acinetobacter johnsonii]MCU4396949.1 type I-F CRISPR-associated endoribonuclease Cas6/Csy4 [Acinetobacter junii]MDH1690012.1 type I-F CRISPR-associated endoribonuclease Cas6/Csy4 [Aci
MNYYIEVTLMENDQFSPYELWSQLYPQLHLALVEAKNADNKVNIGFSFPQYRFHQDKGVGFIGTKLRLFAESEADLKKLDIRRWLERLEDYVHVTSIREVPNDIKNYAIYKRKQVKTNAQRLARHRVKRGDIGFDEALARYSNVVTTTNMPYIEMKSLSTSDQQSEKRFKLFIEKQSAEKSETQVFSTYGLSSVSSVPEF